MARFISNLVQLRKNTKLLQAHPLTNSFAGCPIEVGCPIEDVVEEVLKRYFDEYELLMVLKLL